VTLLSLLELRIGDKLTTITHEKAIYVSFVEELRGRIHKGLSAIDLLKQNEWNKSIEVL
jgi:hypothetical protein